MHSGFTCRGTRPWPRSQTTFPRGHCMTAREVIYGCAYEGRPASVSTWVCFSWPQAPQPCCSNVCVFGLIHFIAAAELPSSRPPKPKFHSSFFICCSSQDENPHFKGQVWVFFFLGYSCASSCLLFLFIFISQKWIPVNPLYFIYI